MAMLCLHSSSLEATASAATPLRRRDIGAVISGISWPAGRASGGAAARASRKFAMRRRNCAWPHAARAVAKPSFQEGAWETDYDVLGLGQAMVDFSATVDDDFLASWQLDKGVRKLVDHVERGRLLSALDGASYKIAAGGSLSNTLVALARLGAAEAAAGGGGAAAIRVGMAGTIGRDPLGDFYRAKVTSAGVHFVDIAPAPTNTNTTGDTTGSVMVLTTGDAQRTMLACLGSSGRVRCGPTLRRRVVRSRLLVVEGYLWEDGASCAALTEAMVVGRRAGAVVAVTASDVSAVQRSRGALAAALRHADVLFCNADEAASLVAELPGGGQVTAGAETCARVLARAVPLVVVTDGHRGSYLARGGDGGLLEVVSIPACWSRSPPVDTCGAGDAYAAGIIAGLLRGAPLPEMGALAARAASAVIKRHGARLSRDDAADLIASPAWGLLCAAGNVRVPPIAAPNACAWPPAPSGMVGTAPAVAAA